MAALATNTIVSTILSGARNAFDCYEKITGDHWLGVAPESFLQTMIALEFRKLMDTDDRFYLTLEASIPRILADADIKIDRRSIRMSLRSRFDILLWRKGGTPRAIIEIKKGSKSACCNNDALRIKQWLRANGSTIELGYLVVYTAANSWATIERRFKAIKENTGAAKLEILNPEAKDDEGWFWGVACFELRP